MRQPHKRNYFEKLIAVIGKPLDETEIKELIRYRKNKPKRIRVLFLMSALGGILYLLLSYLIEHNFKIVMPGMDNVINGGLKSLLIGLIISLSNTTFLELRLKKYWSLLDEPDKRN